MRNVILAAALAATFCLSQTSHAQQGAGGAGSSAPAAGTASGAAESGPGQGAGGPPTSGSFSMQDPLPGSPAGNVQPGIGGAGQAGGQTLMGTGGQTFYGPADPGAAATPGSTGTAPVTPATGTNAAGSPQAGTAGSTGDVATSSPRANERTVVGPTTNDAQVEISRLRAEVDRLRAELDQAKGIRRDSKSAEMGTGTGGSGPQQESAPQPIASAVLEGRVSKVSKKSIEVIDHETGEPYVLRLNEGSRARSGQRRIPVSRIREGSEVRASFDLIAGDTYATQIDVKGKKRR